MKLGIFQAAWRQRNGKVGGTTARWVAAGSGLCGLVLALATPVQGQNSPSAGGLGAGFTLQTTTDGGGIILLSPSQERYASNTAVMVMAVPDTGWSFLGWLGDLQGSILTNVVLMNRDRCVQAVFGSPLFVNAEGGGGAAVVPRLDYYPYGAVCRIEALPESTNYFVGWEGVISGGLNPLTFTVTNASPNLGAVFAELPAGQSALTIQVTGAGQVTVRPDQANSYQNGRFIQLVAIPDAGQDFVAWGGNASGSQVLLDILMDQSKVITATFTSRPQMSLGPCLGGSNKEGFQFTVEGLLGGIFRVDWSANLSSWNTLVRLTNTLGKAQWLDQSAVGQEIRYYRALPGP